MKRGSSTAAQKIWERYYARLIRDAHAKMGGRPRRADDEDDVVQEAFASFFRSVEEGRFPQLKDRDDLWQVLFMLMQRRANDHFREELAQKRGRGRVRGDSAVGAAEQSATGGMGFDKVADREVTPAAVEDLIDLLGNRFQTLEDDVFRAIAVDKLQGYTNREIADRQQTSLRAVERKLGLIRRLLADES